MHIGRMMLCVHEGRDLGDRSLSHGHQRLAAKCCKLPGRPVLAPP